MMKGRNNGKKLMAVRIVDHAFEIVRETLRYTAHMAPLKAQSEEKGTITNVENCRFTS